MSVIGNSLLLGGDAGAPSFTTDRSVRLRSSNSAYFNRTFSSSGTDLKRWTLSFWVKRGTLGVQSVPFGSQDTPGTGAASLYFLFSTSNTFAVFYPNTATTLSAATTAVFRDTSSWYHFVVTYDSTQATNTDRIKIYVNGVQQALSSPVYPSLNATTTWNSNCAHFISKNPVSAVDYFDGYITEINSIDGQALTPSSFGEYDSVRNTQWKPKAYTGTYGTNGFYLKFADNSNNTAATIGKDSSGNSNNWTPNGISVTAGVTYDSMTDVPTLTSATNANFATLNPLAKLFGSPTSADGNLRTTAVNAVNSATILFPPSGKWYLEGTVSGLSNAVAIGICNTSPSRTIEISYQNNGNKNSGGTTSAYGSTYTTNDVIGMAVDCDLQTVTFYKNNTSQGALAFSISSLSVNDIVAEFYMQAGSDAWIANFGQRPFSYTPPTGFNRLNTYNLPDPAVASSDDYHKVYTYTGNGGGLQVGEIQKPASLFNLDRSLRFRSSNSASLSRTFSTPTNSTKFTWSGWVKRGALNAVRQGLIGRYIDGNNSFRLFFDTNDTLVLNDTQSASTICNLVTSAVFRDPSIWYHIVLAVDTSNGTAANKNIIYVNGIQMTFSSTTNYSSGSLFNIASAANTIALTTDAGPSNRYLDGYLADVYFVDGQQLTPTDFGAYDGNFYWTPKAYTGTYGTNGFHLEFEDYSAATAAAIGKDTSGNVNNWTPTGINVTTPANTNASWDSMVDVPTSTSADVANFCTLNPLKNNATLTQGNLYVTTSGTAAGAVGTITVGDKLYMEATLETNFTTNQSAPTFGLTKSTNAIGVAGGLADSIGVLPGGGTSPWALYINGVLTSTLTSFAGVPSGTVVSIAYDPTNGKFWVAKNGTWYNSGDPTAGTNPTGVATVHPDYLPYASAYSVGGVYMNMYTNFGQRPFRYTPPTGFKSLNSFNVAEVVGDVETPDLVWIKSRSASGDHALFNSVTGVGKYLRSNASGAEITDVNSLIQFNKNGFLLGNATVVNASATTFVASAWKSGASTVTNNSGSVATQVRANPTSGISLVTFTTPASGNFTLGHGLGVAPAVVILKNRVGADSMYVYHKNLATPTTNYLALNTTALALTSASIWGSTNPTSSVVTLGTGGGIAANANGLLYCFAEIAGFSKFGSYLSNNATDGPFVYTGFRPRWLMVKRAIAASGTGGWFMYDAERNTYNVMDKYLFAENSAGENTLAVFDFTSNGFKIRSNNVHVNTTSGDTYIYMAFAEHPFKFSLAR